MRKHMTLCVITAVLLAACGAGGARSDASGASPGNQPVTLRLGYFPNFTHAQPIIGLTRGTFAQDLGPNVKIDTRTFNAGGDEINALFAGQIDIAYIGPSPAVNGYVKSKGEDVRIIAGAVSGGAELIVRGGAGINSAADFASKKVATPQLGNTQDVALRTWLNANGLAAKEQGGNVTVIPANNADTLTLFQKGEIDAAWVPEPWGTRLLQEAGGQLFLDEKTLWPDGLFSTTTVIARTAFLNAHPDVVEKFLRAHVETTEWIKAHSDEAKQMVNDGIKKVTGKALAQTTIDAAWPRIAVTEDPAPAAVRTAANHAFELGFLGSSRPDLSKLFDLTLLNKVLRDEQLPEVPSS